MPRRPTAARAVAVTAVILAAVALTTACRPEPGPGTTPTPTVTLTPTKAPPATPEPVETNLPDAGFSLPEQCEQLYSAEMLAALNAQNPPLNDPGVTMHATQNAGALELLSSGIPTIRCSWGRPSEFGLATNVSVITAEQSTALVEALQRSGFGCESAWDGTLCLIEQKTIDLDDNEVTLAEAHFVRDDGWVTTSFINFQPDGYTQDIVSTLWG